MAIPLTLGPSPTKGEGNRNGLGPSATIGEGKIRRRLAPCLVLLAIAAIPGLTGAADKKEAATPLSWAYRKPVKEAPPTVKDRSWLQNPIDAFILNKLESSGLKPNPPAERSVLIRRVTFDLLGIPPTPEEVDAFVKDARPDAYERLVDRLLETPRYGEHTAVYWLDLVRYAESDGFKADDKRPDAWRYRDYVIRALNRDKPFDRFLQEQLAGDELSPREPEALVATGYLRHYPDEYNAAAVEQRRQETLDDITDVTGAAFLGLTIACARCHDHKFDPILQTDYYRLQAFFAAYHPTDHPLGHDQDLEKFDKATKAWEKRAAPVKQKIDEIENAHREKGKARQLSRFIEEYQQIYFMPAAARTPLQAQIANLVANQVDKKDETLRAMSPETKAKWQELNKEMETLAGPKPKRLPAAMGMAEIGPAAPPTYLLKRGDHRQRGEEVAPGFLSAFDDREAVLPSQPPGAKSTGRRSVLAAWLTAKDNPLTARVAVNRIWQQHFGRGIVSTPSDFGIQGDPPTHPELLDWLALEFIERGWSAKAMHRLMVTSAAYRQASTVNDRGMSVDPENRLLWRAPRRRLDGEAIRDAMLAVSGRLDQRMGGPSVYPPIPAEATASKTAWPADSDPQDAERKSIYIFVKRNLRFPFFQLFDVPDTNETCARRHVTTTAPQALAMLNSGFVREQARHLARRALDETGANRAAAIDRAFRLAFGRAPEAGERQALERFRTVAANKGEQDTAFEDLCHALLNLNEFLYLD